MSTSHTHTLLLLFRILFLLFAVSTTLFIFYNSLQVDVVSNAQSGRVMDLINRILAYVNLGPVSMFVVRKLAHFCEYALVAFWFTLCLRVYTRNFFGHITCPLFLTLLVANMDETLQTYVAGRDGALRDVWIDFSGGFFGCCIGLLIVIILTRFWGFLGLHRE